MINRKVLAGLVVAASFASRSAVADDLYDFEHCGPPCGVSDILLIDKLNGATGYLPAYINEAQSLTSWAQNVENWASTIGRNGPLQAIASLDPDIASTEASLAKLSSSVFGQSVVSALSSAPGDPAALNNLMSGVPTIGAIYPASAAATTYDAQTTQYAIATAALANEANDFARIDTLRAAIATSQNLRSDQALRAQAFDLFAQQLVSFNRLRAARALAP